IAKWAGSDLSAPPVIVTTPRTGWWQCACERGGGMAGWLEVARSVERARPATPVWFIAFGGHELGHLGSSRLFETQPELPKRAKAWVHFGANLGSATDPTILLSATDDELLSMSKRR